VPPNADKIFDFSAFPSGIDRIVRATSMTASKAKPGVSMRPTKLIAFLVDMTKSFNRKAAAIHCRAACGKGAKTQQVAMKCECLNHSPKQGV
jgi:hypothetical protein